MHRIALLRPVKTNQQCLCSNFSDSEAPSVFHTEIQDCIVLPLAHRQTDRQTNRQTRGADPSRNQGRRNERRDKQTTDKQTNKDKRAVCRGADRSSSSSHLYYCMPIKTECFASVPDRLSPIATCVHSGRAGSGTNSQGGASSMAVLKGGATGSSAWRRRGVSRPIAAGAVRERRARPARRHR